MLIHNYADLTPALYNSMKLKASFVYNVTEDHSDETVVSFIGFVGDEYEGNDPRTFADLLAKAKGKRVRIQINSGGGFVNAGTHIFDLLSQYKGEVVTEIYGMTASAATVVAQAGKRRMSSNAQMLIHHGWGMTIGNVFDHQNMIETLNTVDSVILGIYERKSPGKAKEIKDLMAANNGDGKWITAEQALEYGLIDEVFTPGEGTVTNSIPENLLNEVPEPLQAEEESSQEDADVQETERRQRELSTLNI